MLLLQRRLTKLTRRRPLKAPAGRFFHFFPILYKIDLIRSFAKNHENLSWVY